MPKKAFTNVRLITNNAMEIYCSNLERYTKLKRHKVSYIWSKTLVLSIFNVNCDSSKDKMINEKRSTKIYKVLDLIDNIKEQYILF